MIFVSEPSPCSRHPLLEPTSELGSRIQRRALLRSVVEELDSRCAPALALSSYASRDVTLVYVAVLMLEFQHSSACYLHSLVASSVLGEIGSNGADKSMILEGTPVLVRRQPDPAESSLESSRGAR